MQLIDLLNKANEGYPDNYLSEYYNEVTGYRIEGSGDTLAEFIVQELVETFDRTKKDEDQLEEARWYMQRAINQIRNVIQKLYLT
jgi:hypothetical protein